MDIVIVGGGKVGYALSEQLGQEGHNITVIDSNSRAMVDTLETLDIMGVHGNGASLDVQVDAGVPHADLLIATTSTDEMNMLCCLMANHLGAKHTIARIRNPEYNKQLQLLKKQFGLSMVINPELEAAREIARVIKFPPALKVDTFSKGRVELIGFKLRENSPLAGKRLMDLPGKPGAKILICAVDRAGEVVIPNGGFMLEAGDKIHITGETRNISGFLHSVGEYGFKIRSVMIVGGGRIGYYLATMLDGHGFETKIIEKDASRCDELCELLPRSVIINGDGSELDTLESEGIDNMDAFIALTGMDEENMIMSMLADRKNIHKVVTKINRSHYLALADEMGIDTVISPKEATANQITQYVRAMQHTVGSRIKTLHKLFGESAEALEFTAVEGTRYLGVALEELPLKKNLLIAVIVRAGKVIIPYGKDSFQLGDSVVVITNRHRLNDLNDIFTGE